MTPDEPQDRNPAEEETEELEEHPYARGVNGILEAVANVIEKERFVEALSRWVDAHSEKTKTRDRYRWHSSILSVAFSIAVFLGLSVLAWNGKIPTEATATLFGSLIGYWFGRQQKKDD
jgi:hypothetical protein